MTVPSDEAHNLRGRISESFVQYYFLVLGITQNVILALLFARLASFFFIDPNGHFLPEQFWASLHNWPSLFSFLHAFLLIVGVYYSYYWYTLYYRRPISFFDVVMPMILAFSEMTMITTLGNLTYYMLSVAFFYIASVATLAAVLSHTNEQVFPPPLLSKVRSSIRYMIANSLIAIWIAILVARSDQRPSTVFVFGVAMFTLLVSYHFWTLRLMNYVAEYRGVEEAKTIRFNPTFPTYLIAVMLVFITCFYTSYFIVSGIPKHMTLYSFAWETRIPYTPIMYVPYYSAFLIPYFLYRRIADETEMLRWAAVNMLTIVLACFAFVLFPTEERFSSVAGSVLERAADWGTGTYNLFPSLHVALSGLAFCALCRVSKRPTCVVYSMWFLLICAATLLTHKHSVADVLGGLLFGAASYLIVYNPVAKHVVIQFRKRTT